MDVGDEIGTVPLTTAAGDDVDLRDYLDTTRVIASPRYYG